MHSDHAETLLVIGRQAGAIVAYTYLDRLRVERGVGRPEVAGSTAMSTRVARVCRNTLVRAS